MLRTFFYNTAFLFFGIFYAPIFLMKIRQAGNPKSLWNERRGVFPKEWQEKFQTGKWVWIHAVSVGETIAVEKFLENWLKANNEYKVLFTTVTPTGQKIAKKYENTRVHVCYFPFDFSWIVAKFFDFFKPVCVLLVETEIWPNFLTEAFKRKIPVGMINARLSKRSLSRYLKIKWFLKPIWQKIKFVLAQSEEDAKRFRALGVDEEAVRDMGNMKFDLVDEKSWTEKDVLEMKTLWGYSAADIVWIVGSTHPGEEEIVARVFSSLKKEFPNLKLFIAPRHIERSAEISGIFTQKELNTILATERKNTPASEVQILNKIGILRDTYLMADFVFIGGSLVKHGGQNPIEAARFKKAILHGGYVFNFEKIYEYLNSRDGAIKVSDENELADAARSIILSTEKKGNLGKQAFASVNLLRGASKRQAGWVLAFVKNNIEKPNS